MKRIAAFLAALHMVLLPGALAAQDYVGARTVSVTSWVEEWDPVAQRWVKVDDERDSRVSPAALTTITTHIVNGTVVSETREETAPQHLAARYAVPSARDDRDSAGLTYGPFRVIDAKRAALVGSTGRRSPRQFDAMLRDHPEIEVLELIEAPGTRHDIANLALGRRIRAAGLRTHVPNGGSVRSGAVELFLAGATRTMEPGAQFAVHSWLDNYGREPADFAPDAPENRLYLDYYVEMGMSEARARDFYAMTNSVPHAGALWLRAADMAPWIAPERTDAGMRVASREIGEIPLAVVSSAPATLPLPTIAIDRLAIVAANDNSPAIDYADLNRIAIVGTAVEHPGAL